VGRPRKPTSLKILDGDRADRINASEPTAPPGIGEPPTWLDRFGREYWEALVAHHATSGLLTQLDVEIVTLCCQSYSTYRHALAKITVDTAAKCDRKGGRVHPMYRIVNAAHKQMTQILSKLGMSPSDRAGLHMQSRPEEDDLLRFLARPQPAPDAKPKRSRPKAQ
jgi:P27 family predicted phage terminase small subunit